jgi:hypothetical protein
MMQNVPIIVEIIENNPNLSSLLGWHLHQLGYQVYQAIDLAQGYLTYQRCRPNLVVMTTELGEGCLGGSSRVDLQACKLGTGRRFTTS